MLRKGGLTVQLQRIPDMPELHQMLSQALEKRGKVASATWRVPNKSVQFVLEVMCPLKGGDPHWNMYYEYSARREQVFNYSSCDVLLVYNLVVSSCNDILGATQATQKIQSTTGNNKLNASMPKPRTEMPAQTNHDLQPAVTASSLMKATELTRRDYSNSGNTSSVAATSLVPPSGDIAHMPVPKLLQTIATAGATGKLDARNTEQTIVVFFKNGLPVDATAPDTVGDDALIELISWRQGQFNFEPRVLRHSHTVHHSVDKLVAQSKQYSDQLRQLEDSGMHPLSTFAPVAEMDEMDFIHKLSRGTPTDMGTLGRFFRSLSGKQNLDELCRTMGHSRIMTVHIVHHLVKNGAVRLHNGNQPAAVQAEPPPLMVQPRQLDGAAIQAVMMSLRRLDTGMFLYPAFLYFLEQEFFRTYRSRSALSVIVFEVRFVPVGGTGKPQMLPGPAALDAVLRISQLKRHQDLLAHYDTYDYALLLPNTKAAGAQTFANRVIKVLTASPLAGGIDASQLTISLGCASIPEDCTDLTVLLGAADLAMQQSRQLKQPLVMFRDIKHRSTLNGGTITL
ncbi:MAG TPA: DUF4388 domain-containing protein [Planktothrix sp.]|jgi:hypothetical protein